MLLYRNNLQNIVSRVLASAVIASLFFAGLHISDPDMDVLQDKGAGQQVPALQPQPSQQSSHLKLTEFWPGNPELWFGQIDCIFATQGAAFSSFNKFCHTVAALKHNSLLLNADIIRAPPEDLYAAVRARLLASQGSPTISGLRSW
jgi:hypothetical protein